MNQLFQQLNQGNTSTMPNSNIMGIKKMMQGIKMASNPRQALQSMMTQNPQMKQVMDFVQASGGDPRSAFYKLAEQKGVDPNQILNMLK